MARDKRAKGPLGEDASSLVCRLERRALYCWVSGMGSFAQHCAGQKGAGMRFGGFSFLSFSCSRLLDDLVSLDLSLDGLEFLRYEIRSENCSFVGVPQLEHDLSLRIFLDQQMKMK